MHDDLKIRRIHTLDPVWPIKLQQVKSLSVQRSVVKELLENWIDAGATELIIRVEQGGSTLIEIMDNGRGIHAERSPFGGDATCDQ